MNFSVCWIFMSLSHVLVYIFKVYLAAIENNLYFYSPAVANP